MAQRDESESLGPVGVPPEYWLTVCRGKQAAVALIQAASVEELEGAFQEYPIVGLPEFPAALEAVGRALVNPQAAQACSEVAGYLREFQAHIQQQDALGYLLLLKGCAVALVREYQGDGRVNLRRAIELLHEAAAIIQAGPLFAECLLHEGNARQRLAGLGVEARGNLEAAIGRYEEAAAIFREGPSYAECLLLEGNARQSLAELGVEPRRNLAAAIGGYERAAATLHAGPLFAGCLLNEGTARQRLAGLGVEARGNLEAAARLYREAGDRLRELGSFLDAIKAYGNLGRMALRHDDLEPARDGFGRAIDVVEEVRAITRLMRGRRACMEQNVRLVKGLVEVCLRLERYEEALEYVERGRSRALLDLLWMEDLRPRHVSPEKAAEYQRMQRRAEELEVLLEQRDWPSGSPGPGIDQERRAALSQERTELAQRLSALEAELRRLDPDFFAVARPLSLAGMSDLARRLDRTLVMPWVGAERGVAFFVRPSGEVDHLLLPEVRDAVVQEWMLGPADNPAPGGWLGTYLRFRAEKVDRVERRREWMAQMDQTLPELYAGLMKPIHHWLREHGEQRVALVAAGPLGLLPLHAAAWEEGGHRRYLLEELEIVYAPSAWVLKRCVERKRHDWTPVLGVGNPSANDCQPLPFSEWEVAWIEALVESLGGGPATQAPRSGGGFNRLVGAEATLDQIADVLPAHPIAHFSCHALWDFEQPLDSALMLAGEGRLTLAQLVGWTRLEQARLVVLSACESGTGFRPGSRGEEYLGLPAGFIIAGAQSVVGSLWSVLDPPTALLMVRMYEHLLQDKKGVAEALRTAQLWLRDLDREEAVARIGQTVGRIVARLPAELAQDYGDWVADLGERPFAHPYYWAAFGVFGSPGPVVSVMQEEKTVGSADAG